MKSFEEIIKSNFKVRNDPVVEDIILECMKEAHDQAVDLCIENAEVIDKGNPGPNGWCELYVVDEESLEKVKEML